MKINTWKFLLGWRTCINRKTKWKVIVRIGVYDIEKRLNLNSHKTYIINDSTCSTYLIIRYEYKLMTFFQSKIFPQAFEIGYKKKTTNKSNIIKKTQTRKSTCCKSGFCCCENCLWLAPARGGMLRRVLWPCCCTCWSLCRNFSLWSGAISVLPRNCPWKEGSLDSNKTTSIQHWFKN